MISSLVLLVYIPKLLRHIYQGIYFFALASIYEEEERERKQK